MKPVLVEGPEVDRSGIEAELRTRDTPVVVIPANAVPQPNVALATLFAVGHALGVDFAGLLPRRQERRDAEWYNSHPEEALALQARLDAAEAKRAKRRARNLKEKKP
jgi:hypothetical protein